MTFAELAELFKSERLRKGMSVKDVQDATHISRRNIVALESADVKDLPHVVYTKGFVRSYAKVLGLDPEECAEVVERELGGPQSETVTEVEGSSKGLGKIWTILLVIVLVGGLIAGSIALFSGGDDDAVTVSETTTQQEPQNAAPVVEKSAVEKAEVAAKEAAAKAEEAAKKAEELAAQKAAELEQARADAEAKAAKTVEDAQKTAELEAAKTAALVAEQAAKKEAEAARVKAEAEAKAEELAQARAEARAKKEAATLKKAEAKKQAALEKAALKKAQQPVLKKNEVAVVARKGNSSWMEVSVDGGKSFELILSDGMRRIFTYKKALRVRLGNAGGVMVYAGDKAMNLDAGQGQVKTLTFP
ncbi:MAG: RodZ domain-containing protein [Desulfovibrio sp.]